MSRLNIVDDRPSKQPLNRESLVAASLSLIDERGYEAFSLRQLGESLGVHATAVYRHFSSKDELLESVLAYMLEQENVGIPDNGTPRERILSLLRSLRRAFSKHPQLALPNLTLQDEQATSVMVTTVLNLLTEMGLEGETLVAAYQILETFNVGTNAYDWGNFPDGLEARRRGRRLSGHPAFDDPSRSLSSMQALNDRSFEMAAEILLDGFERLGQL